MTIRNSFFFAVAAAAFVVMTGAAQAQDVKAGEKAFAVCKACHDIGEGAKNKLGPALTGIVGKKAASVEGYEYSPALQKAAEGGLVWTEAALDEWLTNPQKMVPGTKMIYMGMKNEEQRKNLIAYLKSKS